MRPNIAFKKYRSAIISILHSIPIDGTCNMYLYGSAARGDDSEDSDLNILIETQSRGCTILDYWDAEYAISELTGCKVSIRPSCNLDPFVLETAMEEAIKI